MEKQLSLLSDSIQAKQPQSVIKHIINQPSIIIYIDGAARGNPGPAGAGIYITIDEKPTIKKGLYLEEKTNNQAEYLALLIALLLTQEMCKKHDLTHPHVSIFSDSELLVRQMNGAYKTKNPILAQLKKIISSLLQTISYSFTHVTRDKNKIADKLANEGIDKKRAIPSNIAKILADYGVC